MPLVRISLLKGKTPEYVRALCESVHRALVESYNVPPGDRFQIIEQFERDALIYDGDYLGIHRSDDVVFIQIIAGKWRDTATKKALYRHLADRLAESPGLRREDVQVILTPNDRDDWSFGNGQASYVDTGRPGA